MFYVLYLSSLCRRRRWSDPRYEYVQYDGGYMCTVRVNNRDYTSEGPLATEVLAQENAAMRAYLICRNISVNENMYPGASIAVVPASSGSHYNYPPGMSMSQLPQGGVLVNGMGSYQST